MSDQFFVGKYAERSTHQINDRVDPLDVRGYPVFRIYPNNPKVKHSDSWFVLECDAVRWAKNQNDRLALGEAM